MKSILLSVISFLLVMNVCGKNDVDMRTYLKKVLGNLGKIESASYHEQSQSWQPGDTVAITNFHRFIKEYTNPSDSTIGASYVCLDAKDTTRFEFGYDGNVRMISYHEHKGIMIDDFTTRSLPFRLVAPTFCSCEVAEDVQFPACCRSCIICLCRCSIVLAGITFGIQSE